MTEKGDDNLKLSHNLKLKMINHKFYYSIYYNFE